MLSKRVCDARSGAYACRPSDRRRARLIAAILLSSQLASHAQVYSLNQLSPATLPNVTISMGGEVLAIGVQEDGRTIIGGQFISVNGVPRTNLARLNLGGTLDLTWNPSCDGVVSNVIVRGSEVFVAGAFANAGGQSRANLAKLTTLGIGSADALWAPQPNGPVHCIALNGTDLYAGGAFTQIGGRNVSGVAKLSTLGTGAAGTWPVIPSGGTIRAIVADSDFVYLAGSFTSINAMSGPYLAKVTSGSGTVDPAWIPNPNGAIQALARFGDDLIVAGPFTALGGPPSGAPPVAQAYLAKINVAGNGAADAAWSPQIFSPCETMVMYSVSTDGTYVYVTGQFDLAGGLARTGAARFRFLDGQVDVTWFPQFHTFNRLCFYETCWYPQCGGSFGADGDFVRVRTIVQSGSRIYAGGRFSLVGDQSALGLVRLDATTGEADRSFPVQTGGSIPNLGNGVGHIFAIAVQDDGKLLLGGRFELINGEPRLNLARFNTDGTLDPFWQPNPNDRVLAIATRGNDIFVGGDFTWIGGINRSNLAKLSASGSDATDPDWAPNPNSRVNSIALRGTTLCAAGDFLQIGTPPETASGMVFIHTEGQGEILQHANVQVGYGGYSLYGWFANVAMDDTYAYLHGTLVYIGFGPTQAINLGRVRIDTGQADATWRPFTTTDPFSTDFVESLVVSGTNIFIGGSFTLPSGKKNLARLDYNTGQAIAGWGPDISGYASMSILPPRQLTPCSSLVLSGNQLYVGGTFTNLGGTGLSYLARVDALGSGAIDTTWFPQPNAEVYRLAARNDNFYAVGFFGNISGTQRSKLAYLASPDAPSLVSLSPASFVVLRNPNDGLEVTHFLITEITGGALYHNDGVTVIRAGDFITADQGETGLIFSGESTGTVSAVSALNDTPQGAGGAESTIEVGLAPTPAFSFSTDHYSTYERENGVRVTVRKQGVGAAGVRYATVDGTAVAYDPSSDTGDYNASMGTLNFSSAETSRSFTVFTYDDQVFKGDRTFWIQLTEATGNGQLVYPAVASITLVEDDSVGSSESLTDKLLPDPLAPPPSTGVLRVFLEPAEALGQWRLLGDAFWRNQGTSVGGLVTGNYPVEFRPLSGYREPATETIPIESGEMRTITRHYTDVTSGESGELIIVIEPENVASNTDPMLRGQWRKQGEGEDDWRDSGVRVTGLNAGIHVVEFKTVPNHATPLNQSVVVGANQRNIRTGTYLVSNPIGGHVPLPLSLTEATTVEPYLFNGQLRTDLGFGSGVVVKERVVLTASHVLFDDRLLSYVLDARWFFQRHRDVYEPVPQTPRGWYAFEGYAAARNQDIMTGTSPGVSTPNSQIWDAAALFFVETPYDANYPGRGGFAGYLSSDSEDNEWLVSSRQKMLVGYPLDSIDELDRGRMHATMATNLFFRKLYERVHVTSDIRSFPGNSGGPLLVRHDNGNYYPAAIYLGGFAQSLVRGIDSQVVDLINRADRSGNERGNHTGGGVALWSPGVTSADFVSGLFRVDFAPLEAVTAGGGWRIVGAEDPAWISNTNLYYPLDPGAFNIQFKPLPGYITPPSRRVEVFVEQATIIDALYEPVRLEEPLVRPDLSFQMTLLGETGRHYTIQWSQSLSNWADLLELTNMAGATPLIDVDAPGKSRRFYRALEE